MTDQFEFRADQWPIAAARGRPSPWMDLIQAAVNRPGHTFSAETDRAAATDAIKRTAWRHFRVNLEATYRTGRVYVRCPKPQETHG